MYLSPIKKIYGELQIQMVQEDERMVMKAVRKVGVNVDKGALIKALEYDRNQYTKGYEDGKNEVLDKIRAEIEAIGEGITSYHNDIPWIFKDEVLKIIDKYKEESEDKE